MRFIENGVIKLGVDLDKGGSITYLSEIGKENMINNYDLGRQVQMSFYSGPVPYEPDGKKANPAWVSIGWNPIQSGDVAGNHSRILAFTSGRNEIYVKCIPMHWPLTNVPGECTYECWIRLEGNTVKVRSRIVNHRPDTTQFPARNQELPAVYTNAPYHRLVTYMGSKPYTHDTVSILKNHNLPQNGWITWQSWQATESWAANLDDNDYGLGIWNEGVQRFSGGYYGDSSFKGGTRDVPTAYIAPNGFEVLDHNITYDYHYVLIVGKLDVIRNYVYRQPRPALPAYHFDNQRQHWYYQNTTDKGWPVSGGLEIKLNSQASMSSPMILWKAADASNVVIDADWPATVTKARVYFSRWGTDAYSAGAYTDSVVLSVTGGRRRYTIPLTGAANYSGIFNGLKIMPDPNGQAGAGEKVKIYSISLAQDKNTSYRDLFTDTWVAADALGRTMPDAATVGPVKKDKRRITGIFYITWHSDNLADLKSPYAGDVTKVLAADPSARLDAHNPQWKEGSLHWGEPENGYFLSKDEYVIRKDMSMLADAGVDVLVMDVTNAVRYWSEWDTLFTVMQKMKAEGNKVPQFCFWAFNGPVITVVQDLYDKIYKAEKYKDLWFYWDNKPLLLYNDNPAVDANGNNAADAKGYSEEVKRFFTLRTMWWGYYEWAGRRFIGTEDNWSFGYDMGDKKVLALPLDSLASRHHGRIEEAAVTPAQHPASLTGKSWSRQTGEPSLNQYDLPDSAYVPWLKKTVKHPEGYGIYFQQRWDEALKTDPDFLYLNDWNEWTAGKYQPEAGKTYSFMRRDNPYFFVDQYNSEFNRTIQPMKGGYTDNYYMQMAQNIRRYKGVRSIPVLKGISAMKVDGDFADWGKIKTEYRDTKGDVFHRSHKGYGGTFYVDSSGRNDIVTCKVAVDNRDIYFYAETADVLTSSSGNNWMLLLIDADKNPNTGWHGYDFLVNRNIVNDKVTTLMRYDAAGGGWKEVAQLNYRYKGNALELAVPRRLLGVTGSSFTIDFHWSDHVSDLNDPISLCTSGDSAPNRRFNYRCIWER